LTLAKFVIIVYTIAMDNNPLSPDEESKVDHMTEGDGAGNPPGADFKMAEARRDFLGGNGEDKSTPEQEAKPEKIALKDIGDVVTLSAQGISDGPQDKIHIILGTDNPAKAGETKSYELKYVNIGSGTDVEGKSWVLLDPDPDPGSSSSGFRYVNDGIPLPLGRDSKSSGLPINDSRSLVSNKHALLVSSGELLTLVQRGKNGTVIESPKGAVFSADLKNQPGITMGGAPLPGV
jgi:hypothetical protein